MPPTLAPGPYPSVIGFGGPGGPGAGIGFWALLQADFDIILFKEQGH